MVAVAATKEIYSIALPGINQNLSYALCVNPFDSSATGLIVFFSDTVFFLDVAVIALVRGIDSIRGTCIIIDTTSFLGSATRRR